MSTRPRLQNDTFIAGRQLLRIQQYLEKYNSEDCKSISGDKGIDGIYLDMFKCFYDKSFNNGQTTQNVHPEYKEAHYQNLLKICDTYKASSAYKEANNPKFTISDVINSIVLDFIKVLNEVSSEYLEGSDINLTKRERESLSALSNISEQNIMEESTLFHVKDLQKVIKKVQYYESMSNNGNFISNDAPVI